MADQRGRCRLTMGLQCLELWATTASQIERNQVYDALFAVADGSAFWRYRVLRDSGIMPGGGVRDGPDAAVFFIVVRDDLIIKIDLGLDAFGISYIGSRDAAPGLDTAVEAT